MGWYALLWAVPACAAVAALSLVLLFSRRLEEAATGLLAEVRRLPELRASSMALKDEFVAGEAATARVWHHWQNGDARASSPRSGAARVDGGDSS